MENVERTIDQAIEDGTILGAVLVAKDKAGNLDYHKAFGSRQIEPEQKPMEKDTIFTVASLTKLMTSIAALQLVERGLVTLDEDVTRHLKVLAKQEVIVGFQPKDKTGTPVVTEKRKGPITLRQLLTHSSGIGYDFLAPEVERYKAQCQLGPGTTIDERFGLPLIFQPGEGWAYGAGVDWAGKLVEQLSGLTLERYMEKHIWNPLGIKDITFWPAERPQDYSARHAAMSIRDTKTGKAVQSRKPFDLGNGLVEAAGGQGAFASVGDFMKIVHSLLLDDEQLLKKETAELMFKPQLSPPAKAALLKNFKQPEWAVGSFPDTEQYDWGFGGILIDGDKHPYRQFGTLIWSGAPNLAWFIDRTAGLCGIFGIQLLPSADPAVEVLIKSFEDGVYNYSSIKTKL